MSLYSLEHIQDLEVFLDWVEEFQIGSGINDKEEFAGNFLRNHLRITEKDSPEYKIIVKQIDHLNKSLYTGYDGFVPSDCTKEMLYPLGKDLLLLGWNRKLTQVKLKFYELRFYIPDKTEAMSERIFQAMKDWGLNEEY